MKTSNHLETLREFQGRILPGKKLHSAVKAVWLQRDTLLPGLLLRGALAVSLLGCTPQRTEQQQIQAAGAIAQPALPAAAQVPGEALIKRGQYLATIAGCNDCHTPKIITPEGVALDSSRLLSGHPQDAKLPPIPNSLEWVHFNPGSTAFVGPWGISYGANLTPDETGIGTWSYEQFETAIRKGKYKGLPDSRPLLPPMPWQMYKAMTDGDVRALFAFLQSIKPVANVVPQPVAPEAVQRGRGNR